MLVPRVAGGADFFDLVSSGLAVVPGEDDVIILFPIVPALKHANGDLFPAVRRMYDAGGMTVESDVMRVGFGS
jgi:hypothetical protein